MATGKHNQRQSKKREGYYKAQMDKTPINKAIKLAKHIARYGDDKAMGVLRAISVSYISRAKAKLKGMPEGICSRALTVLQSV